MRKSEMYTLLGLKLGTSIRRFHFPVLDMDIFSSDDYRKLRNQLYKAASNDQKLGQQMIQILLKGKIEEIKTKHETLILSVKFEYRAELYIAELKLENYKWSFISIYYAGEAPPVKKVGFWAGLAVVALSILLFSAFFIMQNFKETEEAAGQLTEEILADNKVNSSEGSSKSQEESIPLSELEQMAKKMDLVLIDEEEYQKLLREKNLAEELAAGSNDGRAGQGQQADTSEDTLDADKEDSQAVDIYVSYGMAAHQVAQLIVDSNLNSVNDVEELTKFFIEQEIQYRIRTGTHEIPLDATYLDIVHILTNRK